MFAAVSDYFTKNHATLQRKLSETAENTKHFLFHLGANVQCTAVNLTELLMATWSVVIWLAIRKIEIENWF